MKMSCFKFGVPLLGLLLFAALPWVLACSSGGGEDDLSELDGDNTDGDGSDTQSDGDDTTDGDIADRQLPEEVFPSWEDDSIDRFQLTPFCETGYRLVDETFDDETLSTERWTRLGNAGGEADFIRDEDGKPWLDLQSLGGDRLRASTLDPELSANAYAVMSRIPSENPNAVVRLTLAGEDSGENTETRLVVELDRSTIRLYQDETSILGQSSLPEASRHLAILYWSNQGEMDRWRVDVNEYTLLDFQAPAVSIQSLILSGDGLVGEVASGASCLKPDELSRCTDQACPVGKVCGRDNLCHTPRTLSCSSDNSCSAFPGTSCQGIGYGELQGLGTCTVPCTRHADCRAVEQCHPVSGEEGVCRTRCEVNADCEADQACVDSLGIKGCMPQDCVRNGHWENGPLNLPVCTCDEGFVFNPEDLGCDEGTACAGHGDCSDSQRCQDGLCQKVRNRSCVNDEGCPPSMLCHAVYIHDEIQSAGICLAPCVRDYNCLAYERCRPMDETRWACLPDCADSNDACLDQQSCLPGPDAEHYCMPNQCQTYGQWGWSLVLGNFDCLCEEGTSADPTTRRCR